MVENMTHLLFLNLKEEVDLLIFLGKSQSTEKEIAVPSGIDPSQYDEFFIHCRAYNVPVGYAPLQ